MQDYEIAQLNVARMIEPIDSPRLAGFVANLDRINALAERSPGFIWRLQTEDGDATAIRDFGEEYLVNLTVWSDITSLHDYVYRSAHAAVMKRRKDWFERMQEAYLVLWWIPKGHVPTLAEARVKLETIRANGPSPEAFTFKRAYPKPGSGDALVDGFDGVCPA